jgi:hypothetical protein
LWKMMMPWFYKKIAALAQKKSLGNGQLYFEINQYLERHGRFAWKVKFQKHWIAKRYLWQRKDDSRDDLRF